MNCLYLHGFASAFDPENDKILILQKHMNVIPFTYNTAATYQTNIARISNIIKAHNIDIIIGCSLGGFYALQAGAKCDVFAVALNPSYEVKKSLEKYVGYNKNFKTDTNERLTPEVVNSYPSNVIRAGGNLILIEDGDEVINPHLSFAYFNDHCETRLIPGGTHRFISLSKHLDLINNNYHIYNAP